MRETPKKSLPMSTGSTFPLSKGQHKGNDDAGRRLQAGVFRKPSRPLRYGRTPRQKPKDDPTNRHRRTPLRSVSCNSANSRKWNRSCVECCMESEVRLDMPTNPTTPSIAKIPPGSPIVGSPVLQGVSMLRLATIS